MNKDADPLGQQITSTVVSPHNIIDREQLAHLKNERLRWGTFSSLIKHEV